MAQQVWVNASTSVVQIDTSQTTQPAIVYLSTIYAPGSLVTIRDIAGQASATNSIIVSTTFGAHFLDGAAVSSYSITQPYGFITVNPKTSTIWALMNTFAFPDQSAAALVNSLTATNITASTVYSYQALLSTAAISSISTDTAYVRTNLSVGQSTIGNDLFLRSSLTTIGGISTAASLFASTSITTRLLTASSTLQTPFAQLQFSTGLALDVGGTTRTAGLISTLGPLYVGGLISTASDLGVGGSTLIAGELRVSGYTFLQASLSTIGSFTLGGAANLTSSLAVADNALFLRHASVTSNLTVGGSLSVMSSVYVKGKMEVDASLLVYGYISTNSSVYVGQSVSIAGDIAVGGDVYFNDRLLDLNNLSVIQDLYVGNTISSLSSITTGRSLQVAGSTLLIGPVSTASTLTVVSHLSTVGNFGLGGSASFASTLRVAANISSLANLNVGGAFNLLSSAMIGTQLSTLGQAAFYSSVQIQGSVSVFSSLAVSCNVDIGGVLNAKGFNLGGGATVITLAVTQNTPGYVLNVASSTLHTGVFSTLGGIDMGGRFSTPNVIATGSTLFTSFLTVQNNLSTLANKGVGGDLNVLGKTTLGDTLTANKYAFFNVGLSTLTNTNVGGALNVLGTATVKDTLTSVTNATFNTTTTNGVATFKGAGNGVVIDNNLVLSGSAITGVAATANIAALKFGEPSPTTGLTTGFNLAGTGDLTAPGTVFLGVTSTSKLTVIGTFSTSQEASFFSTVQVQGNLSVYSSINVTGNAVIGGLITAAGFALKGAAVVSSLGVTSFFPGFGVNISSSTLAYGLVSTFSDVNVGGILTVGSTTTFRQNVSSLTSHAVGGGLTVYGTTVGSNITSFSSIANVVFGSNSVVTPAVSTITIQASNLAVNMGAPTTGYLLDVTGSSRVAGNILVQSTAPKITLSNTGPTPTNSYSIYTQATAAAAAGAFTITGSDNATTKFLIAAAGNVGINTNAPAFTLDVNGTANAKTLLTDGITVSTVVASNTVLAGRGTAALPTFTFSNATTVGMYTDGTALGFATAGTNRMTIAGAGSVSIASGASVAGGASITGGATITGTVGINNTSPSASYALDITGAVHATTNAVVDGTLTVASLVNPVKAPNGTAAAPSHTFTNAPTVGMYIDGTALGFATNGINRMTIAGNGATTINNLITGGTTSISTLVASGGQIRYAYTVSGSIISLSVNGGTVSQANSTAVPTFTIPQGCQLMYVSMSGAGGSAPGTGGIGGAGGLITGYQYVNPGDTYSVYVGVATPATGNGVISGGGGSANKNGGGYSALVNTTPSTTPTLIAVAGGGGGASGVNYNGGAGGGLTGGFGTGTGAGTGGTQSAGGAAGTSGLAGGGPVTATATPLPTTGGSAASGAGGGSGYYGGGSSGSTTAGAGGGSSFTGSLVDCVNAQGGGAAGVSAAAGNQGYVTVTFLFGSGIHASAFVNGNTNRVSIVPIGAAAGAAGTARTVVGSVEFGSTSGPWVRAYQQAGQTSFATDLSLCTNSSATTTAVERLTIQAGTGYVGINKTAPSVALDVTGAITASGDITAFSDVRYKTNIQIIPNSLEKVCQMRGVYYNMLDNLTVRKVGVLAQEVEAVLPEVIMTDESEEKKKSVAYGNLTAVLIEAVKELEGRLKILEQKLGSQ